METYVKLFAIVRGGTRIAVSLYEMARYVSRFSSFVYDSLSPAYRLATNTHEKATVIGLGTKFVAKRGLTVLTRIINTRLLQEDTAVHLQGNTYIVGIESSEIAVFQEIYDDRDYDRVTDFIPRPGWIVFDIGANVGIFTVQQARRGARVYAFEPNPNCFRRLSKAVAANGFGDVVSLFNVAVGSTSGMGALVVPRGWTTNGNVLSTAHPDTDSISVELTTLDHVVPSFALTHIDLLKIDTEGAELEVLRGADRTLQLVQRVVIEYHSIEILGHIRELLLLHGLTEVLRLDMDPAAGVGILYAHRTGQAAA